MRKWYICNLDINTCTIYLHCSNILVIMKNCFSNNQENSSIFRLANMYNMPETDDEYAKTYNSLSDDEKMFIAQYPTYAAKFYLKVWES